MHQIDPMKREQATTVLVDFCHTELRFQEKKIFWVRVGKKPAFIENILTGG